MEKEVKEKWKSLLMILFLPVFLGCVSFEWWVAFRGGRERKGKGTLKAIINEGDWDVWLSSTIKISMEKWEKPRNKLLMGLLNFISNIVFSYVLNWHEISRIRSFSFSKIINILLHICLRHDSTIYLLYIYIYIYA
jgi:hypothetical protein